MAKVEERCIHRHTRESHPNCFPQYWYDYPEHNLCYLDIEASGLDANNSWMLSWSIKSRGGDVFTDCVSYDEIHPKRGVVNPNFDRRITKSLLDKMKQYTVIVTYYGTGMDIPFIRSRAMKYNLKFPKYGEIAHIDLYYHVRSKMKLNRNSLAQATAFLDIAGKTRLDFSYWQLAALGDIASMKELIEHNEQDVIILEQLHKELEPYSKFTRKSL